MSERRTKLPGFLIGIMSHLVIVDDEVKDRSRLTEITKALQNWLSYLTLELYKANQEALEVKKLRDRDFCHRYKKKKIINICT